MGILGAETGIGFPGISLYFDNVPKGISIFGISISIAGILLITGIIAGIFVTIKKAAQTGQNKEQYIELSIYILVSTIIGSRIGFVIFNWELYSDNFLQIFNFRTGGLSIYGGIIAALIAVYIYCKLKRINALLILDTSILGILICQIISKFGDFFNRTGLGRYTDSIFRMNINTTDSSLSQIYRQAVISNTELAEHLGGENMKLGIVTDIRKNLLLTEKGETFIQVHPVFVYEILLCIILLAVILVIGRKKKFDGELTYIFFAGYCLGRTIIESFKADSLIVIKDVNVGQIISGCFTMVAIVLTVLRLFKYKHVSGRDK